MRPLLTPQSVILRQLRLGFLVSIQVWGMSGVAQAQLLYSFETGLEGWAATGFAETDFISMGLSTSGATEGSQSMMVETGPTFGWDVNENIGPGDAALYNAFNTVAGNLSQYSLDFDVTITPESFASVADPGSYFLLSVAMNSDSPNFPQVFNVSPNLNATLGTFPISIPMTSLPIAENSSFYQINIGTNSNHVNGPLGQGVKYFVDNIRFTELPQLVEETIFSWETPDDPLTPGVNEQFENWTTGFQVGHEHAISALGATDGTSSLEIDRRSLESPSFSWGSQFALSSDTNPDPEIEEIDPTIQGLIDTLVGKINGAVAVAFDVRFDDAFPNTPTWTKFGVHFSDDTGTFYDNEGDSINGTPAVGFTTTVTIPFSGMVNDPTGFNLEDAGLAVDTSFLRIGISTNTNGAGIYQIDNFRLISEVVTDSADFNQDGDVDGLDFLTWQRGFGTGTTLAEGDANGDGFVNGDDLAIWQLQYPSPPAVSTLASAPEPASAVLGLLSCIALAGLRGRLSRRQTRIAPV
jgi:hypothetical protein